jgi:hypothetical protein
MSMQVSREFFSLYLVLMADVENISSRGINNFFETNQVGELPINF